MITEDYVSFETAKLLKEKGFNKDTYSMYMYDKNGEAKDVLLLKEGEEPVLRPTLQMAMKWLRDVHGIHIGILVTYQHLPRKYEVHIMRLKETNDIVLCPNDDFDTYEEACEAAIKYCLENLI